MPNLELDDKLLQLAIEAHARSMMDPIQPLGLKSGVGVSVDAPAPPPTLLMAPDGSPDVIKAAVAKYATDSGNAYSKLTTSTSDRGNKSAKIVADDYASAQSDVSGYVSECNASMKMAANDLLNAIKAAVSDDLKT